MSNKRFFSSDEISSLQRAQGVMDPVAYSLRSPMAQLLLVTRDLPPGDGVCVRATTLCPLTWSPYSQSVSIPLDDERVVRNLSAPGAECVLAEPTRDQLRAVTICGQRAPDGICEADIARLKLCKSLYVDVPSIASCPINLECVVDHVERYHTHLIAFTRVVGASIDDAYLFKEREQIIATFPTNFVDDLLDANGNVRRRVGLLRDIYPCPTFPYAPKSGWGDDFDRWMHDLRDEAYLSQAEYELLLAWRKRWDELFPNLDSPERAALKTRLTDASRLIVQGRWAKLHAYLGEALRASGRGVREPRGP
jgi:flavin reductase (DIM6/NTAB) family NADH-FMN oxidoreductase RutF